MGLPLWTVPQEQDSHFTSSEPQAEKDQARARSTIRRQRVLRSSDPRVRRARRVYDGTTESVLQALNTSSPGNGNELDSARIPRIPPLDRSDSIRIGSRRTPQSPRSDYWDSPLIVRSPTPPGGTYSHSDVFIYQRAGAMWRQEVDETERERVVPPIRPRPSDAMLSHPSLEERYDRRARLYELYEESARLRGLRGPGNTSSGMSNNLPSISDRFAPSPPLSGQQIRHNSVPPSRQSPRPVNGPTTLDENSALRELPPLRRMGRRSIADTMTEYSDRQRRRRRRRQAMDGLGDRDRSLSPEGDSAWDTLLTTLTPDPQPPSASSSFATESAAASAASLANSASTSMTSVNNDLPNTNPCEYEVEDPSSNSDLEDENEEGTNDAFESLPFWPTHPDPTPTRADGYPTIDSPAGLTGMLRLVTHLANRQDIPDDWWAEAGLSRNLPSSGTEDPI